MSLSGCAPNRFSQSHPEVFKLVKYHVVAYIEMFNGAVFKTLVTFHRLFKWDLMVHYSPYRQ